VDAFERAVAGGLGNWPAGTVFLAAVSGGADSTAMLAALSALGREGGFSLRCLHVDHGIRPRAERRGDAEAVRRLCGALGVPLRIAALPPGRVAETGRRRNLGLEGAARLFRRRIWNAEARRTGAARVLTAHTRDDFLETVLMRVLRGSGPGGLAGIAPARGRVIRPLLNLSRGEVLGYLERRGLSYRIDSTNADTRYLRNRIRHKLIPLLDEFFPPWKKSLLLLAETQGLAAEFLAGEARKRIGGELFGEGALRLGREAFFAAPPILREEALLRGADLLRAARRGAGAPRPDPPKRGSAPPRRGAVRSFVRGGGEAADLGPLRVEGRGEFLTLRSPAAAPGGEGFSLLIKAPGIYTLEGLVFRVFPPGGGAGGEGFFALLPLVLRSGERGITAEDSRGPAARIGAGAPVKSLRREPGEGACRCVVESPAP
jgi:tRNA(Ile)-lysidine synthase